jgi:alkylated DNA repair protein alkB family protein 1
MAFPAMPSGVEFSPEAAIVNYYGPSMLLASLYNGPFSWIHSIQNCLEFLCFFLYLYCNIMFSTSAGDMLGGHVDDMEADWTKPIVSIRYNVTTAFLYHDLPFILT